MAEVTARLVRTMMIFPCSVKGVFLITLLDVRLIAIRYAARDTHLFEFALINETVLPAAEPGAHIDIHLPNGIERSYSLTTPESEPRSYTVGIKLDAQSRGGSKYFFDVDESWPDAEDQRTAQQF